MSLERNSYSNRPESEIRVTIKMYSRLLKTFTKITKNDIKNLNAELKRRGLKEENG